MPGIVHCNSSKNPDFHCEDRTGVIIDQRSPAGWDCVGDCCWLVPVVPSVCDVMVWCDDVSVPAVTGLSPVVVSVLSRLLPPPPTPPLL